MEKKRDSGDEKLRKRLLDYIEKLESSLFQAHTRERKIGHAFATSGLKVAPSGCSLDWGLILLNEGHSGVNEVRFTPRLRWCVFWGDLADVTLPTATASWSVQSKFVSLLYRGV